MKINREEIDVLCLALMRVQETSSKEEALVFEGLRSKLREHYPHNASMNKLIKQYNKKEIINEQQI